MRILTVKKGADGRWTRGVVIDSTKPREHDTLHAHDLYIPCWCTGLNLSERELAGLDLSTWPADLETKSAVCEKPNCAGGIKRVVVG